MRVFAIDPGTTRSAWVIYEPLDRYIVESGIDENAEMLKRIEFMYLSRASLYELSENDILAVEMIASYGMPVGAEVFETCLWIGRFVDRYERNTLGTIRKVYRREVKMHLCGSPRANDAAIRQRILDIYGGRSAIGVKKTPGPLYGLKADMWAALAVAITAAETKPDAANLVQRAA